MGDVEQVILQEAETSRDGSSMGPESPQTRLVWGGLLIFAATLTSNLCNFLFQFFMSRTLSAADFGTMNALLALTMILVAPGNIILMGVSRRVSRMKAKAQLSHAWAFFRRAYGGVGLAAGAVFGVFLLSGNLLTDYLHLDSRVPVTIAGAILVSGLILPVNLGALQGLQAFGVFGMHYGLAGFARLISGIALVALGLGVNGALAASLVANVLVLGSSTLLLRRFVGGGSSGAVARAKGEVRRSAPLGLGIVCFATLTNADVVLVKHFFPPDTAGAYAAASVLGRAILYFPVSIAMAMFPLVAESHVRREGTHRVLRRALAMAAVLTCGALTVYILLPELMITLLMGEAYRHAAPLVRWFGIAMAPFALLYVLISFHLARYRSAFVASLLLGCAALVGLVVGWFHESVYQVIGLVAVVGLSLLLVNLVAVVREARSERRIA